MNFTQSAFFVLLAFAIAAVAVTTRGDIRKVIILGCSFVFYGWWDWRFLGLVLVSTTIDFLAGLLIESSRRISGSRPGVKNIAGHQNYDVLLHPISREKIERVYDRKKYDELLRIEQHGTPDAS